MKKISFSERYGLQQAVLDGTKTMTRRIIPDIKIEWNRREEVTLPVGGFENDVLFMDVRKILPDMGPSDYSAPTKYQPRYERGEEVAVAQSYKSIVEQDPDNDYGNYYIKQFRYTPGWTNKMFVRADLMPHRIRITDICVERLQDISEEDAMREGVFKYDKPPLHHEMDMFAPWPPYVKPYKWDSDNLIYRCNARAAFASLINRISGRGTWERNPWVYVYEFELIK